jgi:membrane dipeptidase
VARKRHSPEQIIAKRREAEVAIVLQQLFDNRSRWTLRGVLMAGLFLVSCAGEYTTPERRGADLERRAVQLARETLLVDAHVDVPDRLNRNDEDISVRTGTGHFDYVRAREGGLDAPFMSIYVSAEHQEAGDAKAYAERLIDMVEGFEEKWPDKFAVARSTQDVQRNFERGIISLPMGMENGAPIEDDLSNLEYFYDRGIRYITLAHSKNNQICDSSYDEEDTWGGLSPFGRRVIAEMNQLGMLIDISHVSDEAFYEVMALSRTPVIASHSSCRHFTPGFERNMSDEMIRGLASKGGVIQINFGGAFLTKTANQQALKAWAVLDEYLEKHGLSGDDPAYDEQQELYWAEHSRTEVSIGDLVDHFDRVVSLVGIDHVGIGSDFDGVSWLPVGLEDVSTFPSLIEELLRRGYTDEDIRKILSGNLMRVWSEVERHAAEQS